MDVILEIRTYRSLLRVICKKRDAFFLLMLSQLTRDCLRADCFPLFLVSSEISSPFLVSSEILSIFFLLLIALA
jgi:hypothetical protein